MHLTWVSFTASLEPSGMVSSSLFLGKLLKGQEGDRCSELAADGIWRGERVPGEKTAVGVMAQKLSQIL